MTTEQLFAMATRVVVSFIRARGPAFFNTRTGEHLFAGRIAFDCGHAYEWHPWGIDRAADMPYPGQQALCARCIDDALATVAQDRAESGVETTGTDAATVGAA